MAGPDPSKFRGDGFNATITLSCGHKERVRSGFVHEQFEVGERTNCRLCRTATGRSKLSTVDRIVYDDGQDGSYVYG